MMKRFINFVKSMRFGIILLVLIIILSFLGTIIPQGYRADYYTASYNKSLAYLVLSFGFDHVYSSVLFGLLFALLSLNLIFCSISRLQKVLHMIRTQPKINEMELIRCYEESENLSESSYMTEILKKYGFQRLRMDAVSKDIYHSRKNIIGYFGSWMLHFGIIVVFLSYAYGHITFYSEPVYGVPGTVLPIPGTDFKANLREFTINYRKDGSVQQYTSEVDLLNGDGKIIKSSAVSVNHPMKYKGYTFYQTAYGWAMDCQVKKNGVNVFDRITYENTSIAVPDDLITIYINSFYPDFAASSKGITTRSAEPNNPAVLFTLYYREEAVKMDVMALGDTMKWNNYEITLSNPRRYTYLDVNRMKGQFGAIIGTVFILTGLLSVFYLKPDLIVLWKTDHGIHVYGMANRITKQKVNKERNNYV